MENSCIESGKVYLMKRRIPSPPMKCHCGKVAMYRVFRVGYCRDHYAQAVKDQAGVLAKQKAFAIARGFKKS